MNAAQHYWRPTGRALKPSASNACPAKARRKPALARLPAFALFACLLILGPGLAKAHIYLETKLVVNMLPGTTMTEDEINDIVDGVNEIFSQCGNVGFIVTKINQLEGWPGGFRHDANNNLKVSTPYPDLVREANGEIKHCGYKIYIAKGVRNGESAVNGFSYFNESFSVVRERDGIDADARTWAHEILHGFGGKHEDAEGSDPNNLIYPFRRRPGGGAAGSELTPDQCKRVLRGISRTNPMIEVTHDQERVPKDQLFRTSTMTASVVLDGEGQPVTNAGHMDAFNVTFDFDYGPNNLPVALAKVSFDGLFPRDQFYFGEVTLYLDSDGNPQTGMSTDTLQGADYAIEFTVDGEFPFPDKGSQALLFDLRGFDFALLEDVVIDSHVRGREVGEGDPQSDFFEVAIPLELLGELAPIMNASYEGQSDFHRALSEPFQIETMLPAPQFHASQLLVQPAEEVQLNGSQFTPNSQVRVIWQTDITHVLAEASASANGTFDTSITIPNAPAGDYYLNVIDDEGHADIVILTVPPPASLLQISANGRDLRLLWESLPGRSYQIETSRDLLRWTPAGPLVPADPVGSMTNGRVPDFVNKSHHGFVRVQRRD